MLDKINVETLGVILAHAQSSVCGRVAMTCRAMMTRVHAIDPWRARCSPLLRATPDAVVREYACIVDSSLPLFVIAEARSRHFTHFSRLTLLTAFRFQATGDMFILDGKQMCNLSEFEYRDALESYVERLEDLFPNRRIVVLIECVLYPKSEILTRYISTRVYSNSAFNYGIFSNSELHKKYIYASMDYRRVNLQCFIETTLQTRIESARLTMNVPVRFQLSSSFEYVLAFGLYWTNQILNTK